MHSQEEKEDRQEMLLSEATVDDMADELSRRKGCQYLLTCRFRSEDTESEIFTQTRTSDMMDALALIELARMEYMRTGLAYLLSQGSDGQ